MSAFDIAASGMAAHRAEMDLIAQNIANAGAKDAVTGAPYRDRYAVLEPASDAPFAAMLSDASSSGGTFALDSQSEFDDASGLDDAFAPESAPAAGVRYAGFVEGSPVATGGDPIEQMVSLVAAGRAYDADVASLQAAKQMDLEAIEVDRQ